VPIYSYSCKSCGWSGEFQRPIGDHIKKCPKCNADVKPKIHAATRVWGKGGRP